MVRTDVWRCRVVHSWAQPTVLVASEMLKNYPTISLSEMRRTVCSRPKLDGFADGKVSSARYRRGRVCSRVYPISLRSSRVGSAPTKYPYPKAFYPGVGCRKSFEATEEKIWMCGQVGVVNERRESSVEYRSDDQERILLNGTPCESGEILVRSQSFSLVAGAVLNGRLSPLIYWYKVYIGIKVPTNDCLWTA
eukprot:scaffold432_cov69-Cyclotella_meneghiniana.AAC.23